MIDHNPNNSPDNLLAVIGGSLFSIFGYIFNSIHDFTSKIDINEIVAVAITGLVGGLFGMIGKWLWDYFIKPYLPNRKKNGKK